MSNRRGEKKNPDGQEVKALGPRKDQPNHRDVKASLRITKRHRPEELSIPISDMHTFNTIMESMASTLSLWQEKSFLKIAVDTKSRFARMAADAEELHKTEREKHEPSHIDRR